MYFLLIYLFDYLKRYTFIEVYFEKKVFFFSYLNFKKRLFDTFKNKSNTILILKTDAIGDYLIFRPYLSYIRSIYPKTKLILVGNVIWKDLAEQLDSKEIDEFYWINKKNDLFNLDQETINLFLNITQKRYLKAIYPVYSRENIFGDFIMSFISAKEKATYMGDEINNPKLQEYNSLYTKCITVKAIHDQSKHKEFFEILTNKKIEETFLKFSLDVKNKREQVITISPGSSQFHKMWSFENWLNVIDYILIHYPMYELLIIGDNESSVFSEKVEKKYNGNKSISNLINKTTLMEVIALIAKSKVLLTVDSMAVHIGYQTSTPTICLYKGNHYGRFLPYSNYPKMKMCIPSELNNIEDVKRIILFYKNEGLNIELITVENLISNFNQMMLDLL